MVTKFIRQCPVCQKLSQVATRVNTEPFTSSKMEPMDTVNIDSIGEVPEDEFGNKYILTVICCFSRFVELYALKDLTARTAARCLLQHIGRYGAPVRIRSDRGPQFANEVIAELLKLVGTEHQLTLAYSSEENGIVERANKEVMRHLRAILLDKNVVTDWAMCLPLVQRIMNASVHSSIGVSPAQILFGNAITLDKGIFLPHIRPEGEKITLSEWAEKMQAKQAQIIKIAQKVQTEKDDSHVVRASPERTEFPINSYVLVSYRERPPTKFHTQWNGPMRVVNFSKNTYSLQNLVNNQVKDFHITQLKAFNYDEMETDPADVARREAQEFTVDQILQHRGGHPKNSKATFEVLVKWAGYTDEYNSWEGWEQMKNNDIFNRYLYENRMRSVLTPVQKAEVEEILRQERN